MSGGPEGPAPLPEVDHGDPLAPYAGHGGKVGRVFATSEPWWPERP